MSIFSSFLNHVFGVPEKHITAADIESILATATQPNALPEVEAIAADWLKTEALALDAAARSDIENEINHFVPGAALSGSDLDGIITRVLDGATNYAVSKVDGLLTHEVPAVPPVVQSGEVVG